ncbi:MAG: DUF6108 family protein [Alloprevotella sp.]|nr:DUF6108 family protein [Alloprevotella sp.]
MKRILILLFILLPVTLAAQQGLHIASLFGKDSPLAKRKDVTTILLSGKQLKSYNLTRFRSVQVGQPTAADVQLFEKNITADIAASKDKQIMRRGQRLYYVFCQLSDLQGGTHRYIIYRNKGASHDGGKDIHLIYIEGKATANELKSMF